MLPQPGTRPQRRPPRLAISGFTLLEMVMVIVLLGFLSFSALILFPTGVDRVALARQLANDIRLAQSHAMNLNAASTIASAGSGGYRLCPPSPATCTETSLAPATVSSFSLTFDDLGATADATILLTLQGATAITVIGATGMVSTP